MKHLLLPLHPHPASCRDLDFPEELPEQRFLDREIVFRHALRGLPGLCLERGCRPPEVFISHAHGDAGYERWVARDFAPLLREAGIRVILDKTDNGPGTSLKAFIDLILSVEWVLAIGTPLFYRKSLPKSGCAVAQEVQRIAERMRDDRKKDSVIPVLLAGEKRTSLPQVLWERVYVDLRDMDRYHAQMFDLILQLYGLLNDETAQEFRYAIQDGCPVFA